MAYNQIIKKKAIDKLTKNGMEVVLSVATQTSEWTRADSVATGIGQRAAPIVQSSKTVFPTGTVEVCIREPEHSNDDPRDHITGVAFNENGEGKSLHFEIQKK